MAQVVNLNGVARIFQCRLHIPHSNVVRLQWLSPTTMQPDLLVVIPRRAGKMALKLAQLIVALGYRLSINNYCNSSRIRLIVYPNCADNR